MANEIFYDPDTNTLTADSGQVYLTGNFDVTGNLGITGDTTLTGDISLTGDIGVPSGGSITISSGGTFTLDSGSTTSVTGDITINTGSTTTFSSGSTLDLNSGSTGTFSGAVNVASGGALTIQSGGSLTVDSGATITNNGTSNGFGLFASYAIIVDEKADGTGGGTATSGSWQTRDLNTEYADPDSIVSISSNEFILQSGNYLIEWSAPAQDVNHHQTRLYNVTDSTIVAHGTKEFADATADEDQTRSVGSARVSIVAQKNFRIEHRVSATSGNDNGYGRADTWGDGTVMVYTIVKIFKEAS